MRTLIPAVLAALVLVPSAHAKGIASAKVCGTGGCESLARADERTLFGGASANPPTEAEPFVRLRLRFAHGPEDSPLSVLFLPRSGRILAEGDEQATWAYAADRELLAAAAARVGEFPASRLPARLVSPIMNPDASRPADDGGSGGSAWWLALAAVPLGLAVLLARRSRRPSAA